MWMTHAPQRHIVIATGAFLQAGLLQLEQRVALMVKDEKKKMKKGRKWTKEKEYTRFSSTALTHWREKKAFYSGDCLLVPCPVTAALFFWSYCLF